MERIHKKRALYLKITTSLRANEQNKSDQLSKQLIAFGLVIIKRR